MGGLVILRVAACFTTCSRRIVDVSAASAAVSFATIGAVVGPVIAGDEISARP
jgi:hypothetical protein